jgi:hypothetical protein
MRTAEIVKFGELNIGQLLSFNNPSSGIVESYIVDTHYTTKYMSITSIVSSEGLTGRLFNQDAQLSPYWSLVN